MGRERGHVVRSVITPVALTAVVALLALVVGGLTPTLKDATIIGLINLTLVISLYVFVGNSGIFSFGHSAFMLVGAYVTGILIIPTANKSLLLTLPHWLADLTLAPLPAMLIAPRRVGRRGSAVCDSARTDGGTHRRSRYLRGAEHRVQRCGQLERG